MSPKKTGIWADKGSRTDLAVLLRESVHLRLEERGMMASEGVVTIRIVRDRLREGATMGVLAVVHLRAETTAETPTDAVHPLQTASATAMHEVERTATERGLEVR